MTPFVALMFACVIVAPLLNVTWVPLTVYEIEFPASVVTLPLFVKLTVPFMTWFSRICVSAGVLFFKSAIVVLLSFAKAALVGARTVYFAVVLFSTSVRLACLRKLTNVDKSAVLTAV